MAWLALPLVVAARRTRAEVHLTGDHMITCTVLLVREPIWFGIDLLVDAFELVLSNGTVMNATARRIYSLH